MTPAIQLTEAQLRALITSLPVYCASTLFTLSGVTYTSTQLVTVITALLDASTALTAERAAMKAALLAREKSITQNGAVVREVRDTLTLMFNNVPATLSAFAIAPRKARKPLTAEARAAATAKLRATRKARGTTSKKQKAQISGNVTGVSITPITGSADPAPTATTAAAAPNPVTPGTSNGSAPKP